MSDAGRRIIRATADFFVLLDEQLPSERGPNGEPSVADFQASDLLDIVEAFAVSWDDLPRHIQEHPGYRVLIARGRLVRAYWVLGQLAPDGAVELVDIDIELS